MTQEDSFVRGSVRRQGDGERGTSKSTDGANAWSSLGGDGGPADLQKTKGQGHEHSCRLCDTGMPVRNGNLGNDRTTTIKTASVRKQLGTKNSKSNEGRQEKDGVVKPKGSAEDQATVGRTHRKDGG